MASGSSLSYEDYWSSCEKGKEVLCCGIRYHPCLCGIQPVVWEIAIASTRSKFLHKYCNFYCSFHSFGRNISKLYSYSLKNLCLFSNLNLPGFDCQSASLVLLIVRSKRVVLGIFCVWRYSCTVIKTFSDKLSQAVFSLPLWHFTLH